MRGTRRALYYRASAAAASSVAPNNVATAVSWWDATVGVTSSGGIVSQWNDQITTNHLTPDPYGVGRAGPTTGSLTVNSLNTISVVETQTDKDIGRALPAGEANKGCLYIVAKINAVDGSDDPLFSIAALGGAGVNMLANNATAFKGLISCNSIGATDFGGASSISGLHTFRLNWDTAGAGPIALQKDFAADSSNTGFTGLGTPKLDFFGNNFNNAVGGFQICEILLCSDVPSASDDSGVHVYWTNKWGVP